MSLSRPAKTIIVEPLQVPATAPPATAPAPAPTKA
jgi:hypothetical protein